MGAPIDMRDRFGMGKISWGIVATVAEPAPLVQSFVAHHLHMGAAEVHIFLDDPDDPVADMLRAVSRCIVTRCDRDWWVRCGISRRPGLHTRRQHVNATAANAMSGADFLLHCDADEFLRPDSDIAGDLFQLPESRPWLKIPNLERGFLAGQPIETIFDGVFKRFAGRDGDNAGKANDLATFGFTGHAAGKAMTRCGQGLKIGIHAPRIGKIRDRNIPPHRIAKKSELVHFDGLTPLHWAAKLLRYAAQGPEQMGKLVGEKRTRQVIEVLRCIDDRPRLRRLYDQMNALAPHEIAAMEASNLVVQDPIDMHPALETFFPDKAVDISATAFDASLEPKIARWLRQARKHPEFQI